MGPTGVVTIRPAQPAEHERLRELTFAAKAHWGYDHDLVCGWADELEFESEQERWVAEADGAIVAGAGLAPPAGDETARVRSARNGSSGAPR